MYAFMQFNLAPHKIKKFLLMDVKILRKFKKKSSINRKF